MIRCAVDVGGTFVDTVLYDTETRSVRLRKDPSSRDPTAHRALAGLAGMGIERADEVVNGTTLAINTLLEGLGSPVVLVTTRGFRDILEIGRFNRVVMYDLQYRPRPPIVPRFHRLEVTERVASDGSVVQPLDQAEVDGLRSRLGEGVAVAVCLINSYVNPDHERSVRDHLRSAGVSTVECSSALSRDWGEFERFSTAVLNAHIAPVLRGYLEELQEESTGTFGLETPPRVMRSNGGIMTLQFAAEAPIHTLHSGPAGGVTAAANLARTLGMDNVLAADMGGTSFDVCAIAGGLPRIVRETDVAGYPVQLPTLDIVTIGAGGGSIVSFDETGVLNVGPQSAGADPGPAAYDKGGIDATVADCNCVVGRLGWDAFLDGSILLNKERANDVVAGIANQLGLAVEQAALGALRLANVKMANAIRRITLERGQDPRLFTLIAYGGNGPLHACEIARQLAIKRVVVPQYPAHFSAWGMLAADFRHDTVRVINKGLSECTDRELADLSSELEGEATEVLRGQGVDGELVTDTYASCKYEGQLHTLELPLRNGGMGVDLLDLRHRFDEQHQVRFGHSSSHEPCVIEKLHGLATFAQPLPEFTMAGEANARPDPVYERVVWFEGDDGAARATTCPVYRRERLPVGQPIFGPAVVQEFASTTLLTAGDRLEVDQSGNLVIDVSGSG